jgi:D-aspartate ligase
MVIDVLKEAGMTRNDVRAAAVVTPLDDHMGLDIARSLARRGVTVYGIDSDSKVAGRYSRACHFVQGPDAEGNNGADYLQFLVDFGKTLTSKAVLFPLSDRHALLCSHGRSALSDHYEFVMPEHDTLVKLTTKDGLQTLARQHAIPAPQTFLPRDAGDVEELARSMAYPAILKPTESTYWHTEQMTGLLRRGLLDARAKVVLCRDSAELLRAYERIAAIDDRLVIQEVIPGEDSRLAYISFYLDRQSKPLAVFAGQKYRVVPPGFGSASFARSFYDDELSQVALKLLSATSYQGLGGIEFKKDPRDETYKLIEVNTRFGMWDGLGVRCGIDLPYIAYCDALRLPVVPQSDYRTGVTWIDWQRDVRAAIAYWRQGQTTPGQWLRSLRGEKVSAIYSKDDWRPGVVFTLSLMGRLGERLKSMLRGPSWAS